MTAGSAIANRTMAAMPVMTVKTQRVLLAGRAVEDVEADFVPLAQDEGRTQQGAPDPAIMLASSVQPSG